MEAPYQLAKVERHGGMWKKIAEKVIESRSVRGATQMRRMAAEVNQVINEMSRVGGFAPCQWVIGRKPRHVAEQCDDESSHNLSALEERVDPTTIFAERMALRHEAKKAFVHADSSKRVASALLRKAAPKIGKYQVGDLVSFQRNQRSGGINRNRWSPASRLIGFEGSDNQVGWVICEGVPVCVAMDQVIPANDAQALAYRYLHEKHDTIPERRQQSYVDRRKPLDDIEEEEQEEDVEDQQEMEEEPVQENEMSMRRRATLLEDFPREALAEHNRKRSLEVAEAMPEVDDSLPAEEFSLTEPRE